MFGACLIPVGVEHMSDVDYKSGYRWSEVCEERAQLAYPDAITVSTPYSCEQTDAKKVGTTAVMRAVLKEKTRKRVAKSKR